MKWIAAGLVAIAVLAIVLAVRNRTTTNSASPGAPGPSMLPSAGDHDPRESGESGEAGEPGDSESGEPTPMVVDQYGNPVDEETAKQILEQMEEDARRAYERPGKGRGKKKHKGRE